MQTIQTDKFNGHTEYRLGDERALLREDGTVSWYSSDSKSTLQDAKNLVAILQQLIEEGEAN
jgi:hypothetical protein